MIGGGIGCQVVAQNNETMIKIAIVNNGNLPLPAVKGGAVEGLIQLLIDYNEIYGNFQFEVYSTFDEIAEIKAKEYHYSSFHFVKEGSKACNISKEFIRKLYNYVSRRMGGNYMPKHLFVEMAKDINSKKCLPVDAIVLEGARLNAAYLKKQTGLPVIQRIHNTPTNKLGQWDIDNAKSTDVFLGISKYICKQLLLFEGNYCKNIELLYNAIDNRLFEKSLTMSEIATIRKRYNIQENDFVVVFTGRLQEYKGVKQLVEAVNNCRDIINLKLLIVGSNTFSAVSKTSFEKSLYELVGNNPNIVFTGYVPYNYIYKYYKIANLAIFPSTWEEPFALTCLEAISCGLPVIITRSGGMPEIVDESCAVVVENDKQLEINIEKEIRRLYNSPDLLCAMSKNAQKRSKLFGSDQHYQKFSEIINHYLQVQKTRLS